MTSLITLTNHPGAALLPCGITNHSKRRVGVENAVRRVFVNRYLMERKDDIEK